MNVMIGARGLSSSSGLTITGATGACTTTSCLWTPPPFRGVRLRGRSRAFCRVPARCPAPAPDWVKGRCSSRSGLIQLEGLQPEVTGQLLHNDGRLDMEHLFRTVYRRSGSGRRAWHHRRASAWRARRAARRAGSAARWCRERIARARAVRVEIRSTTAALGAGATGAGRTDRRGRRGRSRGFLADGRQRAHGRGLFDRRGFLIADERDRDRFFDRRLRRGRGDSPQPVQARRRSWRRFSTWTNGNLPHPCGQRQPRRRDACRRMNLWRWRECWA